MRITDNPQILSLASQQSILFFTAYIKWSDYFSLLFPFVTSKWLLPLNLSEKTLLSESWWSVISIDREFHFFEAITSISIKKKIFTFFIHISLRFIFAPFFHHLRRHVNININKLFYFLSIRFITLYFVPFLRMPSTFSNSLHYTNTTFPHVLFFLTFYFIFSLNFIT